MKNSETAVHLRGLAEVYANTPDETPLVEPSTYASVYTKEAAVALVKAVGGTFKKRLLYEGSDTLIYESQKLPGFEVWVPRDKICRKIPARYECEPLLSPEEEKTVFAGDLA